MNTEILIEKLNIYLNEEEIVSAYLDSFEEY